MNAIEEIFEFNGEHFIVQHITGNGACLFSSISFCHCSSELFSNDIRQNIVKHVTENWPHYKNFTSDQHGNLVPFDSYKKIMAMPFTYGSPCEIMAAAQIYNCRLRVFVRHNESWRYTDYCNDPEALPLYYLRFTGPLNAGHYDVLKPIFENITQTKKNSKRRARFTNRTRAKQLKIAQSKNSQPHRVAVSKYQSQKPESHRIAVSKYQIQNPESHQIAVSKYQSQKPKSHRIAVSKYQIQNPESHQIAVSKYQSQKPESNRIAVSKYQIQNPESHQIAVSKYQSQKPESHRIAASKYQTQNPEVHRQAVSISQSQNPLSHRQGVSRYTKLHPSQNRQKVALNIANNKKYEIKKWEQKYGTLCGFNYQTNLNYEDEPEVQIGPLNHVCTHCNALKFNEEPPGLCCNGGKVDLPPLRSLPNLLERLVFGKDRISKHFLENVYKYNSLFQMTSFGAKTAMLPGFQPTFRIQGQIHHFYGSMLRNNPNEEPKFLQIYFLDDDDDAIAERRRKKPDLDSSLIQNLQNMLNACHVLAHEFVMARNQVLNEDFQIVIRADRKPVGQHPRRYNAPSVCEVAAIIVDENLGPRDIILRRNDQTLRRICETHQFYDSLQYPLMFCYGESGYSIDVPQKAPAKKTVSCAAFYAYLLMVRKDINQSLSQDNRSNHLLYYRSLLNRFLVDMYAKISSERLLFLRQNQSTLRVENYDELRDAINRADANRAANNANPNINSNANNAGNVGKQVVLPSSFVGSPRYMHERVQQALMYVRKYGKPDLFVTFTCNPNWLEIQKSIFAGQNATHRHDIVARVFRQKVKKLLMLILEKNIFGNVISYMYSVEWQKRGLPHIHLLIWLRTKVNLNKIDNLIKAEIPHPTTDPLLHEIIKNNMIHGPCGNINRNSPCMKNGSCSKEFPKKFLKETQVGDDGYPKYKRRKPSDGGFTCLVKKQYTVDNRWVVPYNPVLSRFFSAHINVEYCQSVKAIKYVLKYINKGDDQAAFTLENQIRDEITMYQTGKYLSSNEAAWKIFGFPIHEHFPPVTNLHIHLENGQRVYFNQQNVQQRIANPPKSTLLAFFDLCQKDDFAKTILYCEVPEYYTFNEKNKEFARRMRGADVDGWPGVKKAHIIGRVYNVHPNNQDCFFLRLALHEIRGPTSFNDLKTVDGQLYPDFRSACLALGLVENDSHWDFALQEAISIEFPHKLRELFAIILSFCNLSNPLMLWEKYKDNLAEDIMRRIEKDLQGLTIQANISDKIYSNCLSLIENLLVDMTGKRLKEFGLPEPSQPDDQITVNRELVQEKGYDTEKLLSFVVNNEPKLNHDQDLVYKTVCHSIDLKKGEMFFLDAPGGTGKTFLINLLLARVRSQGKIAIAVASSGIAATLLPGGRTAHSVFKLPLNLNLQENPICGVKKQSNMAEVLRKSELIVFDECTMMHKRAFEAIDRTLRDICNEPNRLMGGKTFFLSGDFRQTLPVVQRGTRSNEIEACLKKSALWSNIQLLTLHQNMRVHLGGHPNANNFSKLLLRIGDGKVKEVEKRIDITNDLCSVIDNIEMLIQTIYPDIQNLQQKPASWLKERAILCPKNNMADEINNLILEKFNTFEKTYKALDSVVDPEDAVHYPVEFLNSLYISGIPPYALRLKVGSPIMLLRNLNSPKLCNGTRLQVTALHNNVIEAKIFTGCGTDETVFIPRIPLIPSDHPVQFKRLQYPVKVCFAITINKAQGQSLGLAGIDLREDCFSHGQLYVACSRVGTNECLKILQAEKKTANVVYREVFDN